jgi:two-component system sensor histidine kinase CpxA
MAEIKRNGRPMVLCFNWKKGPVIYFWSAFVQGIFGLLCLSFFLSLWTARAVSRPLSRLRDTVVKIARGNLSLRMEEKGEDEVADVSRAVNELTSNLSDHIEGMKQLMANISHEMRSAVTNVSLSLELSEEALKSLFPVLPTGPEKERLVRNVTLARDELDTLDNMVASGLLGGKLDLRQEGLELNPLDFSSLCRQLLQRNANRAAHRGISLSGDVEPGLWLLGDEILLDRLLANILDNAVKYTSAGGQIELMLSSSQDFLVLRCLNTHPHLPEEQLKRLCLPYYRAEQGQIQGSGLGLYLASRIAFLHGGKFAIENAPRGLLFTIALPLPDADGRQEAI